MIFFYVTAQFRDTIDGFLQSWGRELQQRVRVVSYDQMVHRRWYERGTYIFSDLERLDAPRVALAGAVAEELSRAGMRVLNHPNRALRRYDLLRALHAAGINRFNTHRLTDLSQLRYPAFLRRENEHKGSLTPILNSRTELDAAVAALDPALDRNHIIAVEYCHTSDDSGLYRKYSVMRVADQYIPRHLLFSRDWVDKYPGDVTDDLVREEEDYLASDPHGEIVRRVFEMAHIDFGRIDYALLDGAVQVWEINTNPTIITPMHRLDERRLVGQARTARRITEAMAALDAPGERTGIHVSVPDAIERQLRIGLPHHLFRKTGRALKRVQSVPPLRRLLSAWDRWLNDYVRY